MDRGESFFHGVQDTAPEYSHEDPDPIPHRFLPLILGSIRSLIFSLIYYWFFALRDDKGNVKLY
jgi:hypothetical protein